VFDLLVALVTTGIEIGLVVDGSIGIGAGTVLLTVLAGAFLVFRRRAPLLVLAGTAGCAWVLAFSGAYPGGAPVLVALYTVADLRERRVSLAALVPTAILLQAAAISSPPVSIGAWAFGLYVQTRRRYTTALEERAAHLEREREQLDEIAVQRERASIARELHDIVAHSVTLMLVGVRGARDVLRTSPDVADETLGRIEHSAEQSIAELRRILVLLRNPGRTADLRPPPTLADLPDLVEDYRRVRLPVQLQVEGTPRPLPGGVELSVYRIVEEALTNVLKHSRPTNVEVRVRFRPSALEIQIADDGVAGPPAADPAAGHGILGMRERASALGGELEAHRLAGGGFRVGARLPIGDLG
jgi:signal transduction histidine kinase